MIDAPKVSTDTPSVYVIDDDDAVRRSLVLLFESVHLPALGYAHAANFLATRGYEGPGCLVCDIRMPGMSGLQFQKRLAAENVATPIIFITGHGDVPMAVAAMRAGAWDFMQKPLNEDRLLERVQEALAHDRRRCHAEAQRSCLRLQLDTLTRREREIMALMIRGQANKAIAIDLGISGRTVEVHRARVLHKMAVANVTELLALVETVDMSTALKPAKATRRR